MNHYYCDISFWRASDQAAVARHLTDRTQMSGGPDPPRGAGLLRSSWLAVRRGRVTPPPGVPRLGNGTPGARRPLRAVDFGASQAPRRLRRRRPVHKLAMFRVRNLVLLWVGRKLWSVVRPAAQRRLRSRNRTNL